MYQCTSQTQHLSIFHVDPVNGRWEKPPPGYLKLNVDGSFRDNQGTYGGVLRDEAGAWIWGFFGRCDDDNYSALQAELMAIKVGLQALKERGLIRVMVETDSSQAVNYIHNYPDECHPLLNLILDCKRLHTSLWSCSISHVSRIYNCTAHDLASLGHTVCNLEGFVWFDRPPENIVTTFLNDNIS